MATSTVTAKKPGKGNLKRAATETRIIQAFETVLKRDGIANVGVNAIIKEEKPIKVIAKCFPLTTVHIPWS